MTQGFCCRCRKKVKMKNVRVVNLKSGRQAKKGICPDCGAKVFRVVKRQGPIAWLLSLIGIDFELWGTPEGEGEQEPPKE